MANIHQRPYGWRARIGLIVPSTNTVNETEFWRMAPAGVTVHTTRLVFRPEVDDDPLIEMESHLPRALEELVGADVDLIVYGCTASALNTPPEETARHIAEATRLPAVTSMGAVLAALEVLDARRIAIGSPYPESVNDAERRFFEGRGFSVTADDNVIVSDDQFRLRGMSRVPIDAVRDLALNLDTPETEAIFLSCTDFATLDAIEPVETALGKPLISSTQATWWAALRALDIDDRLTGFGRLLREH